MRSITEKQREHILRLHRKGRYSQKHIAHLVETSQATVCRVVNQSLNKIAPVKKTTKKVVEEKKAPRKIHRKLSPEAVRDIRQNCRPGFDHPRNIRYFARLYGVSTSAVSAVFYNKTFQGEETKEGYANVLAYLDEKVDNMRNKRSKLSRRFSSFKRKNR